MYTIMKVRIGYRKTEKRKMVTLLKFSSLDEYLIN